MRFYVPQATDMIQMSKGEDDGLDVPQLHIHRPKVPLDHSFMERDSCVDQRISTLGLDKEDLDIPDPNWSNP